LPSGITLNTNSGVLSGTPTQTGTFTPSFVAANAAGTSAPVVVTITISPAPPTLAYEPFGYTAGSGLLANQNGGSGWSNAWDSGASDINATGSTYTNGANTLLVAGGRAVIPNGVASYRYLATNYSSGTYWLSFIARSSNPGNSYAGLSLYSDGSENLFIGQRNNTSTWGLDHGGAGASSATNTGASALLVVKVVLQAGNDNAYLWINPALGTTPSDAAAVAYTNIPSFTFNRIRLTQGLGNGQTFDVDEIRFATNFAAVAPAVQTSLATTISLTSSANPSAYSSSVIFTATVQTNGLTAAAATGSVVFYTTNGIISTNVLSGGSASSLTIVSLPRGTNLITASYSGDGNYLGSTNTLSQVVTNHPPVATNIVMGALAGVSASLKIIAGKNAPTDADGDRLWVSTVQTPSGQGGSVATDGTNVVYTVGSAFAGLDTFTYTVSDGFGGSANALVTVNVITNGPNQNQIGGRLAGGQAVLNFLGIPDSAYALEQTHALFPANWKPLWTNISDGAGLLAFTNNPSGSNDFYRAKFVP